MTRLGLLYFHLRERGREGGSGEGGREGKKERKSERERVREREGGGRERKERDIKVVPLHN